MEDENCKVVTFVSHYGANVFARKFGDSAALRPVPRSLSSSCGSCVFLEAGISLETIRENLDPELTEAVYSCEDGGRGCCYKLLLSF